MTADLLHAVGEALYGSHWQSEMARALQCSDRTIRRYAAGTHEPPPSIWAELREMLIRRRVVLDVLVNEMAGPATP